MSIRTKTLFGLSAALLCLASAMNADSSKPEKVAKTDDLRIVQIDYEPSLSRLSFGLENATSHTVTAWSVDYSGTDAMANTFIYSAGGDFFAAPDKLLAPGDIWMHSAELGLNGDPDLHLIDVGLGFAILDDGTIVGDEKRGRVALVSRQGQLDAARWLDEKLSSVGTATGAIEQLSSLEERCADRLPGGFSMGTLDDELCSFALSDAAWYLELLDGTSTAAGGGSASLDEVRALAQDRARELDAAFISLDSPRRNQ